MQRVDVNDDDDEDEDDNNKRPILGKASVSALSLCASVCFCARQLPPLTARRSAFPAVSVAVAAFEKQNQSL